METSIDMLLGSRFEVEQPKKGFRIAVDTLLLAAAVPLRSNQRVLELGCGVGGVLLAMAARVKDVPIVGIELQPELAALCASNIQRNGWGDRLSVREGDVAQLPEDWLNAFDHVVMNPPYHDLKTHGVSANDCKRIANTESEDVDLSVWVEKGHAVLKDGGILNMIHRGDRQDEILSLMKPLFGAIRVKPICSKLDAPARRIIVRAEKKGAPCLTIEAPFILYGPDGRYSEAGDDLLRRAQEMPW